jgi:hypothetical protein
MRFKSWLEIPSLMSFIEVGLGDMCGYSIAFVSLDNEGPEAETGRLTHRTAELAL